MSGESGLKFWLNELISNWRLWLGKGNREGYCQRLSACSAPRKEDGENKAKDSQQKELTTHKHLIKSLTRVQYTSSHQA
ncbi:hypothetical protein BOTNAR_0123g00010 [Botryotinia narcissicola]|uniref:Uncharacterized protein n=1 Tax=Botryotinia narcissicola TaxID=278944 RepID=A0A4Z1IK49_9HELO|nr:hypothetical protein BOTNAR_0123g00010 [Botryotinia narcissicola]